MLTDSRVSWADCSRWKPSSLSQLATATIKPVKAGAFSTFTISDIKAGRDEDSLEDADGERSYVYLFASETLTIISNIDEERERPPLLDVYKKVAAK